MIHPCAVKRDWPPAWPPAFEGQKARPPTPQRTVSEPVGQTAKRPHAQGGDGRPPLSRPAPGWANGPALARLCPHLAAPSRRGTGTGTATVWKPCWQSTPMPSHLHGALAGSSSGGHATPPAGKWWEPARV